MKNRKIYLLLLFSFIFYFYFSLQNGDTTSRIQEVHEHKIYRKTAGYWNLTGTPIFIDDSDPNYNWSKTVTENDWCSGSGNWSAPYIIENVTINGGGSGNCVEIKNSDKFFIIRNCTLYNSGFTLSTNYGGIRLVLVSNGQIVYNNCSFNNMNGIVLLGSDNNTISWNNASNNKKNGVYIDSSDNNSLFDNTVNNNIINGMHFEMYADNNNIFRNYASNNGEYGIYIREYNNNFSRNIMTGCGAGISPLIITENNGTTNKINGKSLFIYKNKIGLEPKNFTNPGQIMLYNCSDSLISDFEFTRGSSGISISYGKNITVLNNNVSNNTVYGMIIGSSDSIISNNTANNNNQYGIYIWGDDNNISENNAKYNGGYGIFLRGANNNRILNNSADSNNQYGMYLQDNCNYNNITRNTANNNRNGIYLNSKYGECNYNNISENIVTNNLNIGICIQGFGTTGSNYNTITDNTATNNEYGIQLKGSCKKNLISGNYAIINEYGIGLDGNCEENTISGNIASNNNPCGIFLDHISKKNSISGNTANNNTWEGIYLEGCDNIDVSGNIINKNNYTGISLWASDNNTIANNTVNENKFRGISLSGLYNNVTRNKMNKCGIYLSMAYSQAASHTIDTTNLVNGKPVYYYVDKIGLGPNNFSNAGQVILLNCNDSLISNLDVSQGSIGIFLNYCENITISDNNVSNNCIDGMFLYHCNKSNILRNSANNNNYGLLLDESYYNTITENLANNNKYGIYLRYDCNYNNITRNTANYNRYYGISLFNCYNNLLFNNSLSGNDVNARDNGLNNQWDNGTIGNYWGDYTGKDIDDDGIGDSPYTEIEDSVGSQDNYPIWWDPPVITIGSPDYNEFFGSDAPEFNISIDEGIVDTMWYTLDSGTTSYIFTSNNTINQGVWDSFGNGTLIIKFCANDSKGYIGLKEITIRKDLIPPYSLISFKSHKGTNIVNKTTYFTLTASDDGGSGVFMIKYKINDSGWIIYNELFDFSSFGYGDYLISYQAIDMVGNVEEIKILLVKLVDINAEENGEDNGEEDDGDNGGPGGIIYGYNLLILLSIIGITSVYLIKKRHKLTRKNN